MQPLSPPPSPSLSDSLQKTFEPPSHHFLIEECVFVTTACIWTQYFDIQSDVRPSSSRTLFGVSISAPR